MTLIGLHQAFMWDCEECGKENFERAVTVDLPEEEERAMRLAFGIDADEPGKFMTSPSRVKCRFCGSEFAAGPYAATFL